jgi:hypothetical protein
VSLSNNTSKAYLWYSIGSDTEKIIPLIAMGNGIFSYATWIRTGDTIRYLFLRDSTMQGKELLADSCGMDVREYVVEAKDTVLFFPFGSCTPIVPKTKSRVTFKVDMTGQDVSRGVFITGTLTNWSFVRMTPENNMIYSYTTTLHIGDTIAYYFIRNNSWTNYLQYREKVPTACAKAWGTDRQLIVPTTDTIVKHVFGSCDTLLSRISKQVYNQWEIYPNPTSGWFYIRAPQLTDIESVEVFSVFGQKIKKFSSINSRFNISELPSQIYLVKIITQQGVFLKKIVLAKS